MGKAFTVMKTTGIYKRIDGKIREVQIDIGEAKQLYKDDFLSVYPKFFFKKMRKLRGWQGEVGSGIQKEWGIESAIDFGCGSGYYLEGIFNNGAKVKGFEYAYEHSKEFVSESMKDFIQFGDVQTDLVDETFDLSMSIEVAEHILPENSLQFVKNLSESSSKYVILSAAELGDKGTGHINCRPFKDWEEMLESCDFYRSKEETKKLRKIFKTVRRPSKYSNILSRKVTFFQKEGI
jgi:SAM-dependent methyltransferase